MRLCLCGISELVKPRFLSDARSLPGDDVDGIGEFVVRVERDKCGSSVLVARRWIHAKHIICVFQEFFRQVSLVVGQGWRAVQRFLDGGSPLIRVAANDNGHLRLPPPRESHRGLSSGHPAVDDAFDVEVHSAVTIRDIYELLRGFRTQLRQCILAVRNALGGNDDSSVFTGSILYWVWPSDVRGHKSTLRAQTAQLVSWFFEGGIVGADLALPTEIAVWYGAEAEVHHTSGLDYRPRKSDWRLPIGGRHILALGVCDPIHNPGNRCDRQKPTLGRPSLVIEYQITH